MQTMGERTGTQFNDLGGELKNCVNTGRQKWELKDKLQTVFKN